MSKSKISSAEPASREFNIELSKAEVLALANHHVSQCKAVTRQVGKALMDLRATNPFGSASGQRNLIAVGKTRIEAHTLRARGLLSIIKL